MAENKILICIGGPTASGKTTLAIQLAEKYHTEILSVDSRQFYREMNIGTAKPTQEEQDKVPHHFINHVSIHDPYDIGLFEKESMTLLEDRFKQTDILIAVGGSGLYFKAMLEGIDTFPPVSPDILVQLQKEYLEKGIDYLKGQLQEVDPNYFQIVDQHNPVRLIRAISIFRETGLPFSSFRTGKKVKRFFESQCFYLSPPRAILYERINDRVDKMVEDGLIDEVRSLQEFKELKALQTVGYTELFKYFSNEYEIKEAILKIKQHTRQYAKRQLTWFNNAENWMKWEDESMILF
ncbi:MAG: tRNA (adenosine(37)-N6)-dimethylallyltransferase MiaA [Saprospiraceae bacterium]|nr:tRNA (adenosine(37)-N6)-dimethylallyltransferase MiaA [Saprospiraceae bacterium]MDP4580608.1 tRNA (adenosine(37)-N6)-dimethylallyltransferase MiaA [Saprospiraceae bacterium]